MNEKECFKVTTAKPLLFIIGLILLAAFIVYASVVWYRPIESNVTVSGSYDLSITYPDTHEEAYTLEFGAINQYGCAQKSLIIEYIGNLQDGVFISWDADVIYQISLTAEYYDGLTWQPWNQDVTIGPYHIAEQFEVRWTIQDVGAYTGIYPFTINVNTHDVGV